MSQEFQKTLRTKFYGLILLHIFGISCALAVCLSHSVLYNVLMFVFMYCASDKIILLNKQLKELVKNSEHKA